MAEKEIDKIKAALKAATGQEFVADKTAQMIKAMDQGLSARGAIELVTGKVKPAYKTEADLKRKYEKYSLVSLKMLKKAHKQKERILDGKPREEIVRFEEVKDEEGKVIEKKAITRLVYPPDTLINAVADSVYDRAEPKKSIMETTHNHEHSGSINFEHYANKVIAQDIVIEGEFEAVVPGDQAECAAISEG